MSRLRDWLLEPAPWSWYVATGLIILWAVWRIWMAYHPVRVIIDYGVGRA